MELLQVVPLRCLDTRSRRRFLYSSTPMYEKLGVAWATSLLAFIAMAMAPIPWVFHYFGPRLRARSAYEHGT